MKVGKRVFKFLKKLSTRGTKPRDVGAVHFYYIKNALVVEFMRDLSRLGANLSPAGVPPISWVKSFDPFSLTLNHGLLKPYSHPLLHVHIILRPLDKGDT
jgi:hypothetical protein